MSYFETTFQGANDNEPQRLEFNTRTEAWEGLVEIRDEFADLLGASAEANFEGPYQVGDQDAGRVNCRQHHSSSTGQLTTSSSGPMTSCW